ncbi:MAG: MBL fold metallo-hydrolase [bacterium]|jgi:glyoxylase-like metal-dependent hydrolase (beta-lactamase superfamily II)|nr:MBL fold metallo-hydrolase [candidate division KSB1 bacterium]MDH7559204.1 MBL fold metallo-hydrolase [bacterium]
MRLGEFDIHTVVDNTFKMDGGAMFGVVPKTIWRNLVAVDEDNLVPLDMNTLLVRTPHAAVLIDAGMGDLLTAKQRRIFGLHAPSRLLAGLQASGLAREDVDMVILSHLHADHDGGVASGSLEASEPTFPKARHVVQEWEWEDAMRPNERTAAAYFTDHLRLLEKRKLLRLVQGDCEILPGIAVRLTGGHCRGHQMVEIVSKGERLAYLGDLLPTAAHVRFAYIAGVDTFPLRTLEAKKELLPRLAAEGWLVALDHDVRVKIGKVMERDGTLEIVAAKGADSEHTL